jgi:retron-type reverse transcriptase
VDGLWRLLAGGNWNNGTNCRSRARNANNYRWNTNSNIGARSCTRIQERVKLPGWTIHPCQAVTSGKTHNGARVWPVGSPIVRPGQNDMAKRHGNLFERIANLDNLRLAYQKARRGKSRMRNVIRFERNVEENLETIRRSLLNRTFTTSRYQTKMIHEPKQREIYILPFSPDRIVQHAAMNILEPIWDGLMIDDSYACRIGKGQHAGSRRTMEFVRRYRYCLKADISKFYPSIGQDILYGIVRQKIKCESTLWLLRDIIYSYPGGRNAPIGNYTSQWFGNLYLNELDRLVKHHYRVKGYLRYCDDFCLFHDDKGYLQEMKEIIREFLDIKLKLKFSQAEVFPVNQGVDFLGYRHFPSHILLRKSTAKRVRRRLAKLPRLLEKGRINEEQYRSSIASTRGWLRWANTHNLSLALELDRLEQRNAA